MILTKSCFIHSSLDVQTQFAVNQSRPEEITMREDLGNIALVGDDGFGEWFFCYKSMLLSDCYWRYCSLFIMVFVPFIFFTIHTSFNSMYRRFNISA